MTFIILSLQTSPFSSKSSNANASDNSCLALKQGGKTKIGDTSESKVIIKIQQEIMIFNARFNSQLFSRDFAIVDALVILLGTNCKY